jgi:hypothetical protein
MSKTTIPKNNFDRNKPFYPLVMHYLVQLIGFKELGLRGAIGSQDIDSRISQVLGNLSIKIHEKEAAKIVQSLKELLGPLQLRTEQDDEDISIDIDDIAKELSSNYGYLSAFVMNSASNVLILAHELCKDNPKIESSPIWEFLRHCRNAAAHGSVFNLLNGEPLRTASWGILEIVPSLQGNPLFKLNDGSGLISPGDIIRLLWDLEQVYPQIE